MKKITENALLFRVNQLKEKMAMFELTSHEEANNRKIAAQIFPLQLVKWFVGWDSRLPLNYIDHKMSLKMIQTFRRMGMKFVLQPSVMHPLVKACFGKRLMQQVYCKFL